MIWTIGHSTRELQEVASLLEGASIELLVDVRSYPGSRKFPHWGKKNLEDTLNDKYLHLQALGGRRKALPVEESLNGAWKNEAFRGYGDYMQTQEFRDGLSQLIELSNSQRVAFMCSEAVWWRCHRSMIADALVAQGIQVVHLGVGSTDSEHSIRAFAKVRDDSSVFYPAQQE